MTDRLRVAVLASGNGTNLQAILDRVHGVEADVVAVGSDQPGARALARASEAGIPTAVFERLAYPDRAARDLAMAEWIDEHRPALVFLAGYMAILDAAFVQRYAGRLVNVHPSLLPAFPGIGAVDQALAYGVKVFGVTVHLVEADVDSGPVLLQHAVELPDARTSEDVFDHLHAIEHRLVCEAIRHFANGTVRPDPDHPRRMLVG